MTVLDINVPMLITLLVLALAAMGFGIAVNDRNPLWSRYAWLVAGALVGWALGEVLW